jgi:hypothetical protein
MSKAIRISKGGKFAKMFPDPVADKIRRVAQDYGIKSFDHESTVPSKKFYVGEGDRYTGIFADGQSAGFEVVSEHNLGASGLSHAIGEQFQMPGGTYLVRVYYYTKYFMNVYTVVNALPT